MFSKIGLAALSLLPLTFAQITNDFESGWDQTTWATYAPDCNQGGTVSLDTTKAHSGSNSIKVAGAGGYCGHAFFGTTKVPSGDVYVRVWMQSAKALTSEHVTFVVMPDAAEGVNQHLRFGGMSEIMMWNRQDNDATLPDLSPQGIATSANLPAGSWQCLEYHLGTDGTIETWINGAAVPGLNVGPGISNANANGWTRSKFVPKISGVYFGWESYGSATNTFWYDDVAIAGSRVGCSAGGSPGGSPTSRPTSTSKATTLSTSTTVPTTISVRTTTAAPTTSSCVSPKYGQCGGIGWKGCTSCASGSTCKASGDYYSQCL
ncbi:hypothetical protein Q7P36_002640 [Cladosporium allicinum]